TRARPLLTKAPHCWVALGWNTICRWESVDGQAGSLPYGASLRGPTVARQIDGVLPLEVLAGERLPGENAHRVTRVEAHQVAFELNHEIEKSIAVDVGVMVTVLTVALLA